MLLLAMMGCAAEQGPESEPLAQRAGAPARGAPVAQRDATGGFFVAVNAKGTGCPPGSWSAQISADGQTFTMLFSGYEVSVDPRTQSSTKDCVIGLKLSSQRGLTFSLPTIYYGGYAYLEAGVRARQSASYVFRGGTRISGPDRQLVGPHDASFLFTHEERRGGQRTWAPCGFDRIVDVNTQLRLTNARPPANGYMNLSTVDGANKLVVELAWRACQAQQAAPGARSATAATAGDVRVAAAADEEAWSTPTVVPAGS